MMTWNESMNSSMDNCLLAEVLRLLAKTKRIITIAAVVQQENFKMEKKKKIIIISLCNFRPDYLYLIT